MFFFLGGLFALLMRLELLAPRAWLFNPTDYNKLFSMHGIIMVWFFLIPSIPTTLGNFFIPMMIGAKDLAFPKLNLLSWYIFMFGGLVTVFALIRGGVDTGWTFYTPLSTTYLNTYVTAAAGLAPWTSVTTTPPVSAGTPSCYAICGVSVAAETPNGGPPLAEPDCATLDAAAGISPSLAVTSCSR